MLNGFQLHDAIFFSYCHYGMTRREGYVEICTNVNFDPLTRQEIRFTHLFR